MYQDRQTNYVELEMWLLECVVFVEERGTPTETHG